MLAPPRSGAVLAHLPMNQPAVKSALESALVAALVALACLWLLVSRGQSEDPGAATMMFSALGLAAGLIAHWTYMGLALKRAGRSVWWWMLALVLLCPLGSVVAAVLLNNQDDARAA